MRNDTSFARLVSLACHDVRTPLATVLGFAKTLTRTVELEAPADRYVEMIEAASAQMAELLDELSLVRSAAERLGEDRVKIAGEGATVTTDAEAIDRGVSALVQAALRHGGLDEVEVVVRGTVIDVSPITDSSAAVVLGTELRDLGAAVAVRLIEFLGGSVDVDDGTLTIALAG